MNPSMPHLAQTNCSAQESIKAQFISPASPENGGFSIPSGGKGGGSLHALVKGAVKKKKNTSRKTAVRLETSTFPMSQTRAEPDQLLPRRFLHSPPGTSEWETVGQIPAEPKTNTWNWSPNSFSCEKPPTNLQLPGWAGFKLPREEDKLERFYQLKAEGHKVGNLTIVTGRCKRPQMWPCSLGRYGPSAWSPPALRSQNFQPLSTTREDLPEGPMAQAEECCGLRRWRLRFSASGHWGTQKTHTIPAY